MIPSGLKDSASDSARKIFSEDLILGISSGNSVLAAVIFSATGAVAHVIRMDPEPLLDSVVSNSRPR